VKPLRHLSRYIHARISNLYKKGCKHVFHNSYSSKITCVRRTRRMHSKARRPTFCSNFTSIQTLIIFQSYFCDHDLTACNQRAKCAITCIYIVTCLSLGNKYLFRCSKVTTEAANWAPIWSTPSRKQQQWWRLWSGTHFYSRGKRGGALLRAPVCQICWPCPLCCLHPLRTKVLLQQIWVMTEAQYKTH
jgi:hypothetical protein